MLRREMETAADDVREQVEAARAQGLPAADAAVAYGRAWAYDFLHTASRWAQASRQPLAEVSRCLAMVLLVRSVSI